MLSGLKRCRTLFHWSYLIVVFTALTNIMFELFLARVYAAALTSQIRRPCTAELTGLPARFMPIILNVFLHVSLAAFLHFVAGGAALARMAAQTGNTRLEAGYA